MNSATRRSVPALHPQVMGVLNITPDSFSDGGQFLLDQHRWDLAKLREVGQAMVGDGATILDIGGESTRPGASPVSIEEEVSRVVPAVTALADLNALISIDTRHAEVAARCVAAGAGLVNDVSGLQDGQMLDVVSDSNAALCIMHMQGEPQTMQDAPQYRDVVAEVLDFLAAKVATCERHGIERARLYVDPGFGFGKTLDHNVALLRNLDQFKQLGCAVLVGMSRKRMLGELTGQGVDDRLFAGIAAAVIAAEKGADVVRVHDVGPTVDALRVWAAVHEHTRSG